MSTVSIIIPTIGDRIDRLDQLLRSLDEQQLLPDEILICGNQFVAALQNRLDYWQRRYSRLGLRIQLYFSNRLGVNAARNLGIEHASNELLIFLDDDCVADDPLFVFEHVRLHKFYAFTAAIGGPYRISAQASLAEAAYHFNAHYWLEQHNQRSELVDRELLGGNLSLKRSLLGEHLFDASIVFGGSETEFLYRIQKAGLKVLWEPNLKILHQNELSFGKLLGKGFLQGFGFGRRLMQGLQPAHPDDSSHMKSVFRMLRDSRSLGQAGLALVLVYCFESVFQLGIEHAFAHSKYSPSEARVGNYLKKTLSRVIGLDALKKALRNAEYTAKGLAWIKKNQLSTKE